MTFEWFVASRYLRAEGRSKFRALITLLAVGGVTVGVAAAIIVFGVMDGFAREVRSRIVGTNAHVVLLDVQERGILDPATQSTPSTRDVTTRALAAQGTRLLLDRSARAAQQASRTKGSMRGWKTGGW